MIKSIGIIPDGNRRFAKAIMKHPWIGHKYGVRKIREVLHWCRKAGIKYVTLYAFSLENFDRPKKEFEMIMKIFETELNDILKNKNHDVHRYNTKVRIIGKREKLSRRLQNLIEKVEKTTAGNNKYFLNLAIAYSGRDEIVDACKKIAEKGLDPNKIDDKTFRKFLYAGDFPDPDLIIRTSEQRLSGFLLWQSAYSEFISIPKTFPEFQEEDFMKAIEEYEQRERRFGK